MDVIEKVARAIRDTNIRSDSDPCRLHFWISGLFEDDYSTPQERVQASKLADVAIERIARAAIRALQEHMREQTDPNTRSEGREGAPDTPEQRGAALKRVGEIIRQAKAELE